MEIPPGAVEFLWKSGGGRQPPFRVKTDPNLVCMLGFKRQEDGMQMDLIFLTEYCMLCGCTEDACTCDESDPARGEGEI